MLELPTVQYYTQRGSAGKIVCGIYYLDLSQGLLVLFCRTYITFQFPVVSFQPGLNIFQEGLSQDFAVNYFKVLKVLRVSV